MPVADLLYSVAAFCTILPGLYYALPLLCGDTYNFCTACSDQSCRQIEIHPEFGSFSGAFLGTYDKNGKVLCYFKKTRELFVSFCGAFDKYVEILVLGFGIIRKLFWSVFDQF